LKLSEAIAIGATLRPESHQERFCHVENRGLCSDAWGAACEAVQPAVAKFNWNQRDVYKFERAMDALRAVQQHYFARYWQMPARCPGAQQRFIEAGGRVINRKGEIATTEPKTGNLGGITSECDQVSHMAGMVDHLFYAHGWSREKVAEIVQWYEETHSNGALLRSFEHYQINGSRQPALN